ncbi:dTDP-4-dehydrorhamnose reductase [Limoniibacter endophyticus]|uniref:dTDP-4-dehydrorhamnose reductase n=1 Tax=Limoniibacter endophyticus TaxID=1565040 RepID=A0A8J3DNJ4_9HYPH|nr:dTDP-4-dehydrorhamnose reductase [Limoniibacter endophyticus]GHC68109.1 NAD(P)-dependent oxidoreductase [Limoniibacter endophyticus]
MAAKRVLVTGNTGQVAQAMMAAKPENVELSCLGRPDLDITDFDGLRRAISVFRPDVIVNPAAYTAVDRAETESSLAYLVNRDGAGNVARAAAAAGIPIIHLSTDYVFSGDAPDPYVETDAVGPRSVYGASKLAGEDYVAFYNARHVILRTAWVFAPWGNNFARTMMRLAGDRETVNVVADQFGSPTYAPHIAAAIYAVTTHILENHEADQWRGVFHMTGTGDTNWAGFAREIFSESSKLGLQSANVQDITTADYPTPAKRPANSRLSNRKFSDVFGHPLPEWKSGVHQFIEAVQRALI